MSGPSTAARLALAGLLASTAVAGGALFLQWGCGGWASAVIHACAVRTPTILLQAGAGAALGLLLAIGPGGQRKAKAEDFGKKAWATRRQVREPGCCRRPIVRRRASSSA